jgi:hypothetical protein
VDGGGEIEAVESKKKFSEYRGENEQEFEYVLRDLIMA